MQINLSLYDINRKTAFNWYVFTIINRLMFGLFFWSLRLDDWGLKYHLIAPEIGGCIQLTVVLAALYIFNPKHRSIRFSILLLSTFAGSFLAAILSPSRELVYLHLLWGMLIGSTIFGSAFYWESMAITRSNLNKERINRLEMEKKNTEAKLRILQAQIEPHFLFNTLSNILNLFDTDIETGKSMQKDLIVYLESSMDKFRKNYTTIKEEIEMVKAYLNIFKVRMGNRLEYDIEIPDHLKQAPIPPLMVQPLVENSIKHGIEPKVEGGKIHIKVEQTDKCVKIIVADTGRGMTEDNRMGIGLTNIRERLDLIYGEKGRLTFAENKAAGLTAVIEVPYGE